MLFQDAAYAESIRLDTLRREQERAQAERVAQRQRAIDAFRLLPEPTKGNVDVLQIAVRLPDGSRIVRRFLQSDRVALLYTFVQSSLAASAAAAAASSSWIDTFVLVTDYPRRLLVNREATLLHSGITNMALLVVTVNEDADQQTNQQATANSSASASANASANANQQQQQQQQQRPQQTNDERQHVGSVAGF